jgi:hypothetical protein
MPLGLVPGAQKCRSLKDGTAPVADEAVRQAPVLRELERVPARRAWHEDTRRRDVFSARAGLIRPAGRLDRPQVVIVRPRHLLVGRSL